MNVSDVVKWKRCEELAEKFQITIKLNISFALVDKHGCWLGELETVNEVYAFLCGYEHSMHQETI